MIISTEHPTITIIGGTGKEGRGLALRWASAGYKIVIGSRQREKATKSADEINHQLGIKSVRGLENADAVMKAGICVLTVIQSAHQLILESLKDVLNGKILVDATSRVEFHDPRPPEPPCAAQLAQDILGPAVRVVAAFQNVPAKLLTKAIRQPLDADVFVCSDDFPAAEQVILLANAAGMRGYYAGNLANAIVVEGLTSILISMNKHYGVKDASVMVTGIYVGKK
ncbi:MAG: NADPH-dependent F420 reductase [Chloroflexi bacterium RBG_16_47_49]|nr:MAG: NADPH-dependent F420 reductase [Chloroflexi bacterium RBG_16_47_49]